MITNKPIGFYLLGVAAFISGLFITQPLARAGFLVAAAVAAGYHVIAEGVIETIQDSKKQQRFAPNIHILMALAAVGAIAIGSYEEAAMLILILLARTFSKTMSRIRVAKRLPHFWQWHHLRPDAMGMMASLK